MKKDSSFVTLVIHNFFIGIRLRYEAILMNRQFRDIVLLKTAYLKIVFFMEETPMKKKFLDWIEKSNFFDDTSDDFIPLTENFPTWIIQMSNYRIIELDTKFCETSEELEKELFKISFKE